jgi:hypothetical protein
MHVYYVPITNQIFLFPFDKEVLGTFQFVQFELVYLPRIKRMKKLFGGKKIYND